MTAIEHLQQTFTRSTGWPHEGLTDEDAMQDMLTWAALRQTCGRMRAHLGKYSRAAYKRQEWASLADTRDISLRRYIDEVRSKGPPPKDFLFDESLMAGCPALMANYTVPFMVANDYLHRARVNGGSEAGC